MKPFPVFFEKNFIVLVLLGLCIQVLQAAPVRVGFEPEEGFVLKGETLGEGWSVSGEGHFIVDATEKAVGHQSLTVKAADEPGIGVFVSPVVPLKGVRFVDLWVKAAGSSKDTLEVALSIWGSSLGFAVEDDALKIAPVNDEQKVDLIDTGVVVRVDGGVDDWIRLTARQDLQTETWDLFVDGRLKAINLSLDKEGRKEFVIFGHKTASMSLDEIAVGEDNPLFVDVDRDGMPDAEELAAGLHPYSDDRKGDFDLDGISNIEEMLAGASPGMFNSGKSQSLAHVIYVDNLSGNDANDGKRSYPVGKSGPKSSIKAAMAAARDGDTVVVMKGSGIYEEGSRGANGKRLTIKAVSQVTIR